MIGQILLPLALALKNIQENKLKFIESNFVWDSNVLSYKPLSQQGLKKTENIAFMSNMFILIAKR